MTEAIGGGSVDDHPNRAKASDFSRPETIAKQAKTSLTQGLGESVMQEDEDQV